jgi:chromosome segregation ATPase
VVTDLSTLRTFAEIRQRLSQLESALGAHTPAEAEAIIIRLRAAVQQLRQDMNDGQDQLAQVQAQLSTAQDQLAQLRTRGNQIVNTVQAQQTTITAQQAQIDALVTWAQTVTPPFVPLAGP